MTTEMLSRIHNRDWSNEFMSLFKIYKKETIEALTRLTDWIVDSRKKEFEEAVEQQMNKRWFPAKTREKAIRRVKDSPYYLGMQLSHGKQFDNAHDVIAACNTTTEKYVYLDTRDTRTVNGWRTGKRGENG